MAKNFHRGASRSALGSILPAGFIATLAIPAAAFAADTAPAGEDAIAEVVVTAQFRTQRLQETPIAITAVSAQTLEQRGQVSIQEVAAQAPSVTMIRTSASFGPSVGAAIRGVGQFDFNPALEPGVGMYVDDVYYSTLTGTLLDLLDLERVEILRGPQGTLAGKNSIGGAVKLFSKQPEGSDTGWVSGTYGSLHRTDFRGTADFALIPNSVFVRVSGVTKRRDGYFTLLDYGCKNPGSGIPIRSNTVDCVTGKQSGLEYSGARATLLWKAADGLDLTLAADYTSDNSSPPGNRLVFVAPKITGSPTLNPNLNPYPAWSFGLDSHFVPSGDAFYAYSNFFAPDGRYTRQIGPTTYTTPVTGLALTSSSKLDSWGASAKVEWRPADSYSVTSITAYRDFEAAWQGDGDYTPMVAQLGADALSHRQFSQELRLNATLGTVDVTAGAFYFDQTTVYRTHQLILYTALNPTDFLGDDPVTAETKAAFAHAAWHVTDRLQLIGGLRRTEESKSYLFRRLNRDGTPHSVVWSPSVPTVPPGFNGGTLAALNGLVSHYSGAVTDWRVGAQYNWTPDLMTYVNVSTGFKGGGVGPRPFYDDQALPFGPEKVRAYELGAKTRFLNGLVQANAAVFSNDYDDIQLSFSNCASLVANPAHATPCALPQNAGSARVRGAELELQLRPTEGLSIDASASYLDFQYKTILAAARGQVNGVDASNYLGQPLGVRPGMVTPYTPKLKFSSGIQYRWELGNAGSLTPRFDVSYQSEIYSAAVNTIYNRVAPQSLSNARLIWNSADQGLSITGEVTNLFDKYYYISKMDLTAASGIVAGQVGAPRMWAVTVKKSLGGAP